MNLPTRDAGSFRDPSGQIFMDAGRVLRTVTSHATEHYRSLRDTGLLRELVSRGLVLDAQEVAADDLAVRKLKNDLGNVEHVLEHPKLPFIAYPYEWCFEGRRAAALHHLDLHLAALERDFTLSDASAYNVQFQGPRPVFIDHLSLIRYSEGALWSGHRQFCQQFFNPLLLEACRGVVPNAWFRGAIEGIETEDISRLLTWRDKASWNVLVHVALQAVLQRRAGKAPRTGASAAGGGLAKSALTGMLQSLRRSIERLRSPHGSTVWSDYVQNNNYDSTGMAVKARFVTEAVQQERPRQLWDIGCNTGDFAVMALEAGAGQVIGFDFDHGALNLAFRRAADNGLAFLPLWLDAANPSPDQGWLQRERGGFQSRAGADMLLALALLHHLVIGRNLPMHEAVAWFIGLAPAGIIEFVPKSDSMVQRLLTFRPDIFPDYDEVAFRQLVARHASILDEARVPGSERLLIRYRR